MKISEIRLRRNMILQDGICALCHERTQTYGNPAEWPVSFCWSDNSGVPKHFHTKCLVEVLDKEKEKENYAETCSIFDKKKVKRQSIIWTAGLLMFVSLNILCGIYFTTIYFRTMLCIVASFFVFAVIHFIYSEVHSIFTKREINRVETIKKVEARLRGEK